MLAYEAALSAELMARHGVTTIERLQRIGISERVAERLVGRGRFDRAGNNALVSTAWPNTLEHRMARACAITAGVVCFPTGGLVWNLRKTPRVPDVYVWLPHEPRIVAPVGVRVRRTRDLPAIDVVRRRDGIAVVSPLRATFDAAATLRADDLESMIEHGIDKRYYQVPTLCGIGRGLCRKGRAGSARFAEVLARHEPWQRPVESDHELRLERAMRQRGFPPLVRRCRLELVPNLELHPDLGIPEHGFFVEVDHLSWHGGRLETAYDRRRDLKLRAQDYHVERVTDVALEQELHDTIEDLWTIWQRLLGSHTTETVADTARKSERSPGHPAVARRAAKTGRSRV